MGYRTNRSLAAATATTFALCAATAWADRFQRTGTYAAWDLYCDSEEDMGGVTFFACEVRTRLEAGPFLRLQGLDLQPEGAELVAAPGAEPRRVVITDRRAGACADDLCAIDATGAADLVALLRMHGTAEIDLVLRDDSVWTVVVDGSGLDDALAAGRQRMGR